MVVRFNPAGGGGAALTAKIVSGSRTAAAGAGEQTIVHGLGKTPKALIVLAADEAHPHTGAHSWGLGDEDFAEANIRTAQSLVGSSNDHIIDCEETTSADQMKAVLTSMDATNITLTWTKTLNGVNVDFRILVLG